MRVKSLNPRLLKGFKSVELFSGHSVDDMIPRFQNEFHEEDHPHRWGCSGGPISFPNRRSPGYK